MWMNIDTSDYELASCGMATSKAPSELGLKSWFSTLSLPLVRAGSFEFVPCLGV